MYWELDSRCLRHCWLWKKTEIEWQDVTRIGSMNYKRISSSGLEIDFVYNGPLIVRNSMLVDPKDRVGFLAELRKFVSESILDL